MAGVGDHGIDRNMVQRMYDEWCKGATKSDLERRYLDKPESHGKMFSSLVRQHLGIETERRSSQSERIRELEAENARLRALLRQHSIEDAG